MWKQRSLIRPENSLIDQINTLFRRAGNCTSKPLNYLVKSRRRSTDSASYPLNTLLIAGCQGRHRQSDPAIIRD